MKDEIWKPIANFEGLYEVSNMGRVRSLDRRVNGNHGIKVKKGKYLSLNSKVNGYNLVRLFKNGAGFNRKIHRLVALAFIPNPQNKREVNHKFGIKDDNRTSELEWHTPKENAQHASKLGLYHPNPNWGKANHKAKSVIQYSLKGEYIKTWECILDADRAGFDRTSIGMCMSNLRKTHAGYLWKSTKI